MAPPWSVHPLDDRGSFAIAGELDMTASDALADRLGAAVAAAEGDLHLDLRDVTFIDSSGVRAIVQLAQTLAPPHRLVLTAISDAVARILELTGVHRMPEIHVDDPRV